MSNANPYDPQDPETTIVEMTITLPLALLDTEILGECQRAGGHPDVEGVVEQALYHYARHLQVGDVPSEFMTIRKRLNRIGRPWKGGK